jgi:hypothetical protein
MPVPRCCFACCVAMAPLGAASGQTPASDQPSSSVRWHRSCRRESDSRISGAFGFGEHAPRYDFAVGFPGVAGRFEWFAIDYKGTFVVDKTGKCIRALIPDDGSKLYIDGRQAIDNDGTHGSSGVGGVAKLRRGEHRIRVSHFQGPRTHGRLDFGRQSRRRRIQPLQHRRLPAASGMGGMEEDQAGRSPGPGGRGAEAKTWRSLRDGADETVSGGENRTSKSKTLG